MRAVGLTHAVAAVEVALRDPQAVALAKTQQRIDGAELHAIGGILPARHVAGTKTWLHTKAGAQPVLVLWSTETGAVIATIDAFALGQLRTAAITAIATDRLAEAKADQLTLIGTGRQAVPQAAAVASVRSLRRIVVAGRDPGRLADAVNRIRELDLADEVEGTHDVQAAAAGSAIIVTATRSSEPLVVTPPSVAAHVNAIGAIGPGRLEVAPQVVEQCEVVVSDDPAAARTLSNELDPADVVLDLAEILRTNARRPVGARLTLFKAMGLGIADVALGVAVLDEIGIDPTATPSVPRERVALALAKAGQHD